MSLQKLNIAVPVIIPVHANRGRIKENIVLKLRYKIIALRDDISNKKSTCERYYLYM